MRAVSRFYRTPAYPAGSGPDFVNATAALEAGWTPQEAMAHLHAVEARLGRERRQRWGARTMDLDLIGRGALVLPDAAVQSRWRALSPRAQQRAAPGQLIVPHPRVQDRAFVLVPLADIAPDWQHPVTGHSVREMLDALPAADREQIRPLQGHWGNRLVNQDKRA